MQNHTHSTLRLLGRHLAGLFIAFLLIQPNIAGATTYTVNTLADTSSSGTLRWAITEANNHAGADDITFDPSLSGTITLTSDLPNITESLTITGPGQTVLTIDGDNSYLAFRLDFGSPSSVVLAISDLTLRRGDGNNFGLIYNARARLDATRVTLKDTSCGSGTVQSFEGGSLNYFTDCTFQNNQIGIYSDYGSTPSQVSNTESDYDNRIYINGCLFNGNGHGIAAERFVRIDNSTFRNNTGVAAQLNGLNRVQIHGSTFENNSTAIRHEWTPTSWTSVGTNNRLHVGNTFRNNTVAFELVDGWDTAPPGRSQEWTTLSNNLWDGARTWVVAWRYNPSVSGDVSDSVTTINSAVGWTESGTARIGITPSVSSLGSFTTTAGTASSSQSFAVTAIGLSANMSVAATSNFQVSTDNSTFGSSATLIPVSGSVSATIYVRITAGASGGSVSGSVSLSSTGVTTETVTLSGNVAAAPTPLNPTVSRAAKTLKVPLSSLASDVNLDPLTFSSLSSTTGATVSTSGGYLLYVASISGASQNDTVSYTVSDGVLSANGTLTITYTGVNQSGQAQNVSVVSGTITVRFAGIPNLSYRVQRADNAGFTVNVTQSAPITFPASGLYTYTDPSPPVSSAYYRLISN